MAQLEALDVGGEQPQPLNIISSRPRLASSFIEFLSYRELLWTLTIREVKVRYSQTSLGVAWAVAQPLSLMLAFTIFFGRFAGMPNDGVPYPIFYYSALLPWTFFTTCLAFGVPSLVMNVSLVTKVYFPREILPVASVLSALVDYCAATAAFSLLMLIYQVAPTPAYLFLVPMAIIQLVLAIAVTLFFAAINVSYRDVRYAIPLVSQIWLYATPVIYPLSVVPEQIRTAYLFLNPMAPIIESYRQVLGIGTSPDLSLLGLSALSSAILLAGGYTYFKRAERRFADVI